MDFPPESANFPNWPPIFNKVFDRKLHFLRFALRWTDLRMLGGFSFRWKLPCKPSQS
jgi:hypothetical protein